MSAGDLDVPFLFHHMIMHAYVFVFYWSGFRDVCASLLSQSLTVPLSSQLSVEEEEGVYKLKGPVSCKCNVCSDDGNVKFKQRQTLTAVCRTK